MLTNDVLGHHKKRADKNGGMFIEDLEFLKTQNIMFYK